MDITWPSYSAYMVLTVFKRYYIRQLIIKDQFVSLNAYTCFVSLCSEDLGSLSTYLRFKFARCKLRFYAVY